MSKSKAVAKTQGNERINFSAAKGKIETHDFFFFFIKKKKKKKVYILFLVKIFYFFLSKM